MSARTKSLRYMDSGLYNVIIEGCRFLDDDPAEECILIPNIAGLHRAIAHGIVSRPSAMSGHEMRFLRTEMGMTQSELADVLHREVRAIGRWERGRVAIDGNAEFVLRILTIQRFRLPNTANAREMAGWCNSSEGTLQPTILIDGSDPSNYRLKINRYTNV